MSTDRIRKELNQIDQKIKVSTNLLKALAECCNVSFGHVHYVIWVHGPVDIQEISSFLEKKYTLKQIGRALDRLKEHGLIREKSPGVWEVDF